MKLVVTQFVSLDGIIDEPQNWSFPYWNDEIAKFKNDELFASDAQLLGRVTYEGFAAAWPSRDGDFADKMNRMPKYVVSTTLDKAEWENSHVIKTNVPEAIAKLKQQDGKELTVHGSRTLVQTLIQHNLVDEYHLLVYPLVLGNGKRVFEQGSDTKLKLVESKTYDTGVVLLRYQPAE